MASSPPKIYLLPLDDRGAPNVPGGAPYINLPPPTTPSYKLRLAIEGASSICQEGSLWVNIPAEGDEFHRDKYREFKLNPTFGRTINIDIPITIPGSFSYYISHTPLPPFKASLSEYEHPKPTKTELYYITVAPNVSINGERVPLDSLNVLSVLSKFLGPVDNWEPYMKYISEKGYNAVHFTPLMQRGASNSPFSLFDQLSFDPIAFPNGTKDVQTIVSKMEKEYGILSLTDVVWNHTADNSEWLHHHPEAGYNRVTAPWLEPAYELDTALLEFSKKLGGLGYPTDLKDKSDLLKIMEGVKIHVIAQLKLWEFYVVDVDANTKAIIDSWLNTESRTEMLHVLEKDGFKKDMPFNEKAQMLAQHGLRGIDRLGERFRRSVDPVLGAAYLELEVGRPPPSADRDSVENAKETIKTVLDAINLPLYKEYDSDVAEVLEQIYNRTEYTRLADHGPKMGPVTDENPLVESYFTRLPLNDVTRQHDPKSLALANNGWLWNNISDFAGPQSKAYLRREVISWGDCVKLRYGAKPEDSPWLWEFMAKYTKLMAQTFHGFRIDNCHSTPIHVGEYMLDVARRERPDLYTVAELFTGDEGKDRIYLERLGLSSLVREAMVAWGTGELSRLVHRHGGKPIGSFEQTFVTRGSESEAQFSSGSPHEDSNGSVDSREIITSIAASPIHALFMDCTHDNETPTQKRTPQDTLPNGALAAMVDCATGSVHGYDEIYPKLLNLVTETRRYESPQEKLEDNPGIGRVKALLNKIHVQMGKEGFTEMHVHHEDEYITVHRVHPKTHRGYFLIAHTAFNGGDHRGSITPVTVPRTKVKHLGSWKVEVDASDEAKKKVFNDPKTLRGLPSRLIDLEGPKIEDNPDASTTISVPDYFPPGSITLLETWIPGIEGDEVDRFVVSGAEAAFAETDLVDLNFVLYRCEAEERDASEGQDGVYNIPGHGALVYAGLQGWWSVLRDIIRNNDLGHPLCQHLRDGQWALDYTVGRLEKLAARGYKGLQGPADWMREKINRIKEVPSFLLPRYFALVIQAAYIAAAAKAITMFTPDIQEGTRFLKNLSLVSIQMTGIMKSTSLWPQTQVPCMAAGLPHFSYDYMRCWGRDVFISVRGLYLCTGRYKDAREHILAFASVLKHGMIPNLLDAGRNPRYNSRDSIWFFLQCIQDYTKMVPNGHEILKEPVKRRFLPYDDTWFPVDDERAYSHENTLEEIIQEALQRHAQGIKYQEANAGTGIDSQMKWEGFTVEVTPNWTTGFISGGNQWNCGTWMDKMGESEKAGNKGFPGTPRDGAAIEITGMLYSTLVWLTEMYNKSLYKWDYVKDKDGKTVTFRDWAGKIKDNFERYYYIPQSLEQDDDYVINKGLVNRRGIYKDLYGAGKEYEDYQLRANYAIAMTVAPDLFVPEHALGTLELADKVLRGPTGMATLDPADLNYRPYYLNSVDNDDFATSKGRNYHQGPEWLWPTGFFLRAMLTFDSKRRETNTDKVEMLQQVAARVEKCKEELEKSPWAGLTELTQKNSEFCRDSSPTQAWSAGCLIDLFYDARKVEFTA